MTSTFEGKSFSDGAASMYTYATERAFQAKEQYCIPRTLGRTDDPPSEAAVETLQ